MSDLGEKLFCRVIGTNVAGADTAYSNVTDTVTSGVGDVAPENTVAPVISGTETEGQTLTVTDTGTWTGSPTPTFTYQWYRSPSTAIGSATASTHLLASGDVGQTIFCIVTGTNTAGSDTGQSNTTGTIASAAPVNTVAPVISGTETEGQTLTVINNGTWTNSPTFTYQWFRVEVGEILTEDGDPLLDEDGEELTT